MRVLEIDTSTNLLETVGALFSLAGLNLLAFYILLRMYSDMFGFYLLCPSESELSVGGMAACAIGAVLRRIANRFGRCASQDSDPPVDEF